MNNFKQAVLAAVFISFCIPVLAKDIPFSQMEPVERQLLISAMADVLPPYVEATENVLKEIDALPAGTVTDTTELDEVPIAGLFERNATVLDKSKLLSDRDFTGGRADHDIAWLRQSLTGLVDLQKLVEASVAGANVDAEIDKYVTVMGYLHRSPNEYNYQAIIEPVSRFYCNLQFIIERNPSDSEALVIAEETCD